MLCAIFAMAFILDSQPLPDPISLVRQLGSPRYSLRESAEGELARIGRGALPALRAAKNSKDVEIRERSVALLAKIENSLLLQATPISLQLRDVPVIDGLEVINRQMGHSLSLSSEERANVGGRRLSLRSNDPLPFWKAIDALCAAAELHVDRDHLTSHGTTEGSIVLLDGAGAGTGLVSDAGPFRVQISSVHYQSEIQFDQDRSGTTVRKKRAESNPNVHQPQRSNREFFLQFIVTAEPRLSVTRNGPIKLAMAIDDHGQSLMNPDGPGSFQHTSGYFGMSASSTMRLRVDMNYPENGSKSIRSLRGLIPVVVAMRKPDPLVIPLSESKGKLFHDDEVALTLIDYRPALKNQPATIQLSVKSLDEPVPPVDPGIGQPLGYRPDSLQQQIEILDAQGKVLPWFPSGTQYVREETRITMTLANQQETAGIPMTLRYHGIIRANSDVAFEFHDIPIP